ncbi:PREDICTED: transcription elongation factor A N-terminal and central domain-containing protein [Condylura cristata]|uniref:transcription elongation factor A N-terminal and central domain-containing protein n=1 Tax=Condylura cristata TaxID=143302 RepID=UPI00033478B9|nr:PREDICTED: transcription elongation factor A N-terminal and central domain-containing protein [Condylura cristata]
MADKNEVAARAALIERLLSGRNFEDLGDHLAELDTLPVTKELLQETDVVRVVYRVLRTCPTAALKKKAKCLLSQWRALYKAPCCKARASPEFFPTGGNKERNSGLSHGPSQDEVPATPSSDSLQSSPEALAEATGGMVPGNSPRQTKPEEGDPEPPGKGSDELLDSGGPLRARCTKLLFEALAASSSDQPQAVVGFAREIEEHIFALHSKNLRKYKTCIRSKVANLRNPRNPHLSQNLLSGAMSPREFAEMTVLEMASKELKQLRASYTESCIQARSLPRAVEGTPTTKIRCGRCGRFNCQVTMITRGMLFLPGWVQNSNPGEDMMTYVTCNECGEQWYHSKWVCL